ncbi:MAG: major capsid protein [Proteobacteria bacterium]|nr:major capsid protein [Pseudomonadota bacterium]MBU4381572.1 major capsid protein [Pseudomonadota bacterium]MCG2766558.1 major capsid protein [Desulfarculaceae bacterium]
MDTPLGLGLLAWRALTTAINQIKLPPRLLQQLIFKERNTNPSDTIDVDITVGNQKLVPFVSPIEGGTVVGQLGREQRAVKTPRLRPKKPLPAQALLTERGPGAAIYATGGGDINAWKEKKVGMEAKDLKQRVDRTIEWMCAQALCTGALTVSQDNLAFEVDYRLPVAHKPTLTGDNRWGQSAADIPANIETWANLILSAYGSGPDLMLLGTGAAEKFLADEKVQAEYDRRHIIVGELRPDFKTEYIGPYKGLDVYKYPFEYTATSGTKTKIVGTDKAVLVNSAARFTIEFGLILDLDAGANVMDEFFAKSWLEKDPSVLWLLAESRPLPVPWEPEAYVAATVL